MSSMFDRSLLEYFDSTSIARVTEVVGLVAIGLAIVLLAARELAAQSTSTERQRRLHAVDAVAVPLVVAAIALVVIRFDHLSL